MIIGTLIVFVMALATVIQTSVFPGLGIAGSVVLPFLILLYAIEVLPETMMYGAAISAGFFLDLYSTYPFGIHIAVLLFVTFFAHILYRRFFTNRSIYGTLLLTAVSTLVYEGAIALILVLLQPSTAESSPSIIAHTIGSRVIGNVAGMAVLFYLFLWIQHALGRRFITNTTFRT